MNTLIFGDKETSEVLPFTVEFSDRLLVGETITGVDVGVFVSTGTDPDPSTMLVSSPPPAFTDNTVSFVIKEGVLGCIYSLVVTATISSGNVYIKVGYLAIVTFDSFASL